MPPRLRSHRVAQTPDFERAQPLLPITVVLRDHVRRQKLKGGTTHTLNRSVFVWTRCAAGCEALQRARLLLAVSGRQPPGPSKAKAKRSTSGFTASAIAPPRRVRRGCCACWGAPLRACARVCSLASLCCTVHGWPAVLRVASASRDPRSTAAWSGRVQQPRGTRAPTPFPRARGPTGQATNGLPRRSRPPTRCRTPWRSRAAARRRSVLTLGPDRRVAGGGRSANAEAASNRHARARGEGRVVVVPRHPRSRRPRRSSEVSHHVRGLRMAASSWAAEWGMVRALMRRDTSPSSPLLPPPCCPPAAR